MEDLAWWQLIGGWLIALLVAAGGALLLVLSIRDTTFHGRLRRHGVRSRALVVGHDDSVGSTDSPVLEFTDQSGAVHRFTSKANTDEFIPLGQHRDVLYLPSSPDRAELHGFSVSRWQRVWPALLGMLLLVPSVVVMGMLTGVRFPQPSGELVEGIGLAVLWVGSFAMLGTFWVILLSQIRTVLTLRRDGIRTIGTVLRTESQDGIVVEFRSAAGHRIQIKDLGQRRIRRVGTRVPVVHSLRVPQHAKVDSVTRNVWFLVPMSLMSLLLAGAFLSWLL